MKKTAALILGISLLTSTAIAQDIYTKINGDIVQVCNKKTLGNNYKGDTFLHYRQQDSKWIMDHITYAGNGRFIRNFVGNVTEDEIPTYIEGIISLYYDKDRDEENLVAIFEENISSKVKEEWIKLAKEHIKELNHD